MFEKMVKAVLGENVDPEYRFHPKRKWRADYAIIKHKILIEVEGGAWTQGRHTRGAGFIKDMEKYNAATATGYAVLRVTPKELCTVKTLELIKETITSRK